LFSGNVDAQKIKEIAQHYGFSTDTEARRTKNGADLLTVKYNRNQLAHGWESFGNIGREKNAPELLEIQKRVVRYLKEILQNIEKYLNNQEYLDSSTSS
jgi:predicted phage tail protein